MWCNTFVAPIQSLSETFLPKGDISIRLRERTLNIEALAVNGTHVSGNCPARWTRLLPQVTQAFIIVSERRLAGTSRPAWELSGGCRDAAFVSPHRVAAGLWCVPV